MIFFGFLLLIVLEGKTNEIPGSVRSLGGVVFGQCMAIEVYIVEADE